MRCVLGVVVLLGVVSDVGRRKGQVTLFVIFGFLVLVLLGFIFYVLFAFVSDAELSSSYEFDSEATLFQSCVEDGVNEDVVGVLLARVFTVEEHYFGSERVLAVGEADFVMTESEVENFFHRHIRGVLESCQDVVSYELSLNEDFESDLAFSSNEVRINDVGAFRDEGSVQELRDVIVSFDVDVYFWYGIVNDFLELYYEDTRFYPLSRVYESFEDVLVDVESRGFDHVYTEFDEVGFVVELSEV